jgi:hypothetical protein
MIYLRLFHGRDTITEDMDDWGYDGPVLGPFVYLHTTYAGDIKFKMPLDAYLEQFPEDKSPHSHWETVVGQQSQWVEGSVLIIDNCVQYGGKFYGDWSASTKEVFEADKLITKAEDIA